MNNQQHPVLGSAMNSSSQSQRGMPTSQHVYQFQQTNATQLSHLQQQQPPASQQQQSSHMLSNYSTQTSDVSTRQYSPSMSTMNGSAYQPLTGPSLHSNLDVENSVGFHQQNDNSAHQFNQYQTQPHQQSHHHQVPTQHHQLQQQQYQSNSSHAQNPQPQQLQQQSAQVQHQLPNQTQMQQQHNILHSPPSNQYSIRQNTQQASQSPTSKQHTQVKSYQQQSNSNHQQLRQHQPYSSNQFNIQQRNSTQQHQPPQKYERAAQQPPSQPRRILQNTNALHNRMNQQQMIGKEAQPVTKDIADKTEESDKKLNDGALGSAIDVEENEENDNEENEIEEDATTASENMELANTKEKTPMTLVQELAKFNKIERKYTLLDEQGPAHKKTFYVKLLLGTEEYSCSGASIRKAQQSAAAIALKETKFKHPPVKSAWKAKKESEIEDGKLTPTVELNGLAMRRGETALYKAIEPQQPPYYYPPGMDPRAMYSHRYYHYMRASRDPRFPRGYWPVRYHLPRANRAFYVSLRVGHREFIGDGPTRQAARHNAAIKALKVLGNLPEKEVVEKEEEEDTAKEDDSDDALKSHVTSVHETAFRRKLPVSFEVVRESGPPHMKNFVTRCTVGDLKTDGEGNSKKISKKLAAEQMCEKLKELPALPPAAVKPKPKTQVYKKKNRIKAEIQQQKADPNYGVGVNPISRLIQIMCAQKKKEPGYSLVAERGISCRKEFVMQIEVDGKTCTGSGPNKKLAKRAAAEAMLDMLGYNKPAPQPTKSSIKQHSGEGNGSGGEKKVHFSESVQKGVKVVSNGQQQKVPGLLHLPPNTMVNATVTNSTVKSNNSSKKEPQVNLSNILKPNWRPELQLRELCKALRYPLELNDFTKTLPNKSVEHIARITVGPSDGQQNFLGSSTSSESARDMACMEALKVLVSKVKDMNPAGDGTHIKSKSVLSRGGHGMRDTA